MEKDSSSIPKKRRKHGTLAPILLTILFLALAAGLLWHIWNQYAAMRDASLSSLKEIGQLQSRENSLKALLALPPCEAAAAYKK